jgi:hypothetical protein
MQRLRPLTSSLAILVLALLAAALACVLPDDPYQRWQLLDESIFNRARWMYERIHYDTTPVDVVFVGPSRTSKGVDAPRLSESLARLGKPSRVVNFSLADTGRNTNYIAIRELFKEKQPKLVVIGVTEKPARFGHPAFKYLAPSSSIANPGYFGDLNYFSDLVYLPFRQIELFAADLAPSEMGLSKTFDPTQYPGVSINTTGDVVLPDGTIKEGMTPASLTELHRGVRKLEAGMHAPFLPKSMADVEFGDERYYIRQIVGMAKAHGARVAFLFLPYYSGPGTLQEQRFYDSFGPVWNAGFLASHAEFYADYAHLTRPAAEQVTDWLTRPVAAMLDVKDQAK